MRPEDIRRVLIALEGCAHSLNRDQVKQLYQILIACGQYPVCPACNQPITSIEDFTWDHIYPACHGGTNKLSNMVPMHKGCNESKGSQFFEELYDVEYEITAKIVIEPHNGHKKKKAKKSKSRFKAWQHSKTPKQKKR